MQCHYTYLTSILDEETSSSSHAPYSADESFFLRMQSLVASTTEMSSTWDVNAEDLEAMDCKQSAMVQDMRQGTSTTPHSTMGLVDGCNSMPLFQGYDEAELMMLANLKQNGPSIMQQMQQISNVLPTSFDRIPTASQAINLLSWNASNTDEFSDKDCDSRSSCSQDSSRGQNGNLDFGEHTDSDKWATRYNELLEYRELHGHCNVPYHYKDKPFLNSWVKRQRYQYKCLRQGKTSHLTNERIRLLEAINFSWDTHELAWESNFEVFRKHVQMNKHCHIPAKETRLFAWAKRQRRQYKLWLAKEDTTMTEERYRRLTGLGFRWGTQPLQGR